MTQIGHYGSPELHKNHLYFFSDDDLWLQDLNNLQSPATRLTSGNAVNGSPKVSMDGKNLAYLSNHTGSADVYIMNSTGGLARRVTHFQFTRLIGWKDNNTIYVGSSHENFTNRERLLYEVNIHTGLKSLVKLGPVSEFSNGENGLCVIGKNTGDPARWKRYRGGTAGTLWVKENKKSLFKQILKKLPTNLACPKVINERIYFISDHEGVGNIYSVNKKGGNLKRHTHEEDYYVRSFSYNDGRIVFSSGAKISLLDLENRNIEQLNIHINSQFLQSVERYVDATDYLQDFDMTQDAQEVLINARGKLYYMAPWSGAPIRLGDEKARYKLPKICWHKDSEAACAFKLDEENEEHLVWFDLEQFKEKVIAKHQKWGKVFTTVSNPDDSLIAVANNRNELFIVNVETEDVKRIDRSKTDHIADLSWSKDGRYLTYFKSESKTESIVKIYDTKSEKTHKTVKNILADVAPCFNDEGDTLFFLSAREFNPCGSEHLFQFGFPFLTKAYALPLTEKTISPMKKYLEFDVENDENDEESDKKNIEEVIDWKTLENRIEALPLGQGGLIKLFSHKCKLYALKEKVGPTDPKNHRWGESKYNLISYCFKSGKVKTVLKSVNPTTIKHKGKYVIAETEEELRIISLESKPTDGEDYKKKDGWIDLERIKIRHNPIAEWKQMYREAWILQREHFWTASMSQIDWQHVYKKYLPILDLVKTRREFSDLIWEMQGELGTSHAYEMGGDFPVATESHPVGRLGAKFEFHTKTKSFEIKEIFKGDSWIPGYDSPLTKACVSLKAGDHIYGIDGESFLHENSLDILLENKASINVDLLIRRSESKKKEHVTVKSVPFSTGILYRQWVNKNREYVKKKSGGKLGYIHIPDMSLEGLSEFWKSYSTEHECDGLVVDVRYNGGGSVSQLLLKELQQKVLAFNNSRWFGDSHYPVHSVNGPLVCLTNEHAGSDGDIFSHCFKLLGLGKLVGKRTWGGVIGIWPRHLLNDFTMTSQPEFSFWFKDVGFKVENYGTDPDIEVNITPEDWAKSKDPQLDKAIEVVLKDLKKSPPLVPDFSKKPSLKLPKLPKL
ncbi:hypothetical protein A9Q84_09875 [Halobacteriovorax marinus]|uniref:Tricorn protease homolog n=1 Tax=Halobacteriovorax marinus TaxID=97084 RepID=A0A1Y5F6W9_9BACT|nr:hypothetical protein A9Q84_09875 [Halobacteriovorax marinus]